MVCVYYGVDDVHSWEELRKAEAGSIYATEGKSDYHTNTNTWNLKRTAKAHNSLLNIAANDFDFTPAPSL